MFRSFLYSKDFEEGKIFDDKADYDAALESGKWFTNRQLDPDPEIEKAKKQDAKVEKKVVKSAKKGK